MSEILSPFKDVVIPDPVTGYVDKAAPGESDARGAFSDVPIPALDGNYPEDGSDGASAVAQNMENEDDGAPGDFSDMQPDEFDRRAAALAKRLETIDTAGSAKIPSERGWLGPNDPERAYVKELSFDEIAAQAKGWKLHLNFDAENEATTQTVRSFLDALKKHGAITTFKIGHGGGKADDAPGKEATVYIGHRDKAAIVALEIDDALASVLEEPEGDVLDDDISFAPKVMGRFELRDLDQAFHPYGAKGHQVLNEDIAQLNFPPYNIIGSQERTSFIGESAERANAILIDRYGEFYTGKQNA